MKNTNNINESHSSKKLIISKSLRNTFSKKIKKKNSSKELNSSKKTKSMLYNEEESEKNNQDEINNSKFKEQMLKNIELKKNQIKNNVFAILSKDFQSRSGQEIRLAADYLSKNYTYFINLKNNDSQFKVEKLTKICKLEKYSPNEIIILYGDIGDKFYIVLEGSVVIYKPEYVEEPMKPIDFLRVLNKLKEEDELKYERVKKKNDNFYFDTTEIDKIDPNTAFMRNEFNFLMEVEDRKGEYGEGFSFGEIALLKKTTRNATIRSVDNTLCLSIAKDDYNLAMKEIETKKLSKEIEKFQKNYQFFYHFDKEKMIKIFNCLSKIILYKGDFLCHQNEINDNIYIIIKGHFEVFTHISFSWLNEYFNYIDDSLGNILFYMIKNHKMKYSELREIIENIKKDSLNSPMKNINYNNLNEITMNNKSLKDNLYLIKNDEEKINDKNNLFRVNLKKIDYLDLLGLEDSFEFKKKFYSVRCISSSAEVKCIKINELLRIIWNSSNEDILYLLKIIINRKNILKRELINSIKNLEKKILFGFDIRYENLLNYENNAYAPKPIMSLKDKLNNNFYNKNPGNKKKENEINRIVSAIKVKGYKMSLHDILDENIKILPKDKSKIERKLYKNKSAINLNILKHLLKNKPLNHHEFKFKKNITNIILSDNEPKNISRPFSPVSSKRITNYTSFKNNINNIREFSGFNSERNGNLYPKIILHNNIFNSKNISIIKENSFSKKRNKTPTPINIIRNNNIMNLIKNYNSEDKEFEIENYLNYENKDIINKPILLSENRVNYGLKLKRKSELISPKNNVKINKIISFTNSNFNFIRNKISSAKLGMNNMDKNILYTNKNNIFNNFIKKNSNPININLSNDESLIKEKNKIRILSNDKRYNNKNKKKKNKFL